MELLKLLFILIIIAILLWRKLDIGISLLIGAIALAVTFQMPVITFLNSVFLASIDAKTIEIVIAVFFILLMGKLMKDSGSLEKMTASLEGLIRDRRIAMVIPPAFIGLLPAPGGAMLSAPMVEETGSRLNLNPAQKTYINYWFRHLWEYWWPLYPGLIVAAAVIDVPITRLISMQYPISIAAIFAGIIFGLLPIKNGKTKDNGSKDFWKSFKQLNYSVWQLWFILIGLIILKIKVLMVLSAMILIMILTYKAPWSKRFDIIKQSFSWKITLLLFAVMIFKQVLMDSSAVQSIPEMLETSGISPLIPLFVLPFALGILTGVNQTYVAVSFPLLLPFFHHPALDLKMVMFAYVTGFAGVMLSPVHLCLLLTKEYYRADWNGIYRQLLPSVSLVLLAAYLLLII